MTRPARRGARAIGGLAVAVLTAALLTGCGGDRPGPAPQATRPAPVTITAAGLMAKVSSSSSLPIAQVRCYTRADDPNGLLGKAGEYAGRCAWHDTRVEDPFPEVTKQDGPPTIIGGSIEVFERPGDAVRRAGYLESFDDLSPEWHWVVPSGGIVLLRVSRELTRAQADAYYDALRTAVPPGPVRAGAPEGARA
jgi:hypothetical protein